MLHKTRCLCRALQLIHKFTSLHKLNWDKRDAEEQNEKNNGNHNKTASNQKRKQTKIIMNATKRKIIIPYEMPWNVYGGGIVSYNFFFLQREREREREGEKKAMNIQ